jgi:hypothetical protein
VKLYLIRRENLINDVHQNFEVLYDLVLEDLNVSHRGKARHVSPKDSLMLITEESQDISHPKNPDFDSDEPLAKETSRNDHLEDKEN